MIKTPSKPRRTMCSLPIKNNAAVMEGSAVGRYFAVCTGRYDFHQEPAHILMKVETHNHQPLSPWRGRRPISGVAKIRDEGATGRGAKQKPGWWASPFPTCVFRALNSHWKDFGKPEHYCHCAEYRVKKVRWAANAAFGTTIWSPGADRLLPYL